MQRFTWPGSCLVLATLLFSQFALAQAAPWIDDLTASQQSAQLVVQGDKTASRSDSVAPPVATTTDPSAVAIPAGTRVLMVLKSPLHTTSGTAGSGLYLETLYPVIQGNRIVIPAQTQVEGVVESSRRPGHLQRTSEFHFRFTALIFPNNYVAPIQGALQSIPGARNIHTVDDAGTLKTVDQLEKVVTPGAAGAVGGAIVGSVQHYGIGLLPGAGLGAGLGLGSALLRRGDEISLGQGTNVEMVLQAPLVLDQAQVEANARYVPPRSAPASVKANANEDLSSRKTSRRRERRPPGLAGLLFPAD